MVRLSDFLGYRQNSGRQRGVKDTFDSSRWKVEVLTESSSQIQGSLQYVPQQPLEAKLTYSAPQYPQPAGVQHQKECAALSLALPVPEMLECGTQAPGEAGFSEDYRRTPGQLLCSRSQPGVSTNWIIHL